MTGQYQYFLTYMMIAGTDPPRKTTSTNSGSTPECSVHVFPVKGFQLEIFRFHFESNTMTGNSLQKTFIHVLILSFSQEGNSSLCLF